MRLFVAVVPPPGVLADLGTAVTPHQGERAAHRDLRWAGPEDWHVTLAFLGEVTAPVADRLPPPPGRGAPPPPPPAAVPGLGRRRHVPGPGPGPGALVRSGRRPPPPGRAGRVGGRRSGPGRGPAARRRAAVPPPPHPGPIAHPGRPP